MKKFYITLLILLFSLIPFCLSGCGCVPKNIRANMITKYMENKYTEISKEEAPNDSGMLETMLGGVNIFADNNRWNLFKE